MNFKFFIFFLNFDIIFHFKTLHGGFLEGVYEIELDTKIEYEGF